MWYCPCMDPSRQPSKIVRHLLPSDRRKIILSTNVAETSLTIEGVRTVIDSGLSRTVPTSIPTGGSTAGISAGSAAPSADQRAGRMRRTGPGRCIRLWSRREELRFAPFEEPEIHRIDLSGTVLALHSWGVCDPETFGWFDRPTPDRLSAAERLLILLGAIEGEAGAITEMGRRMLDLPVHPACPASWSQRRTLVGFATGPPSRPCSRRRIS